MKRLPIEVQAGVSHGIARPYGTILRAQMTVRSSNSHTCELASRSERLWYTNCTVTVPVPRCARAKVWASESVWVDRSIEDE